MAMYQQLPIFGNKHRLTFFRNVLISVSILTIVLLYPVKASNPSKEEAERKAVMESRVDLKQKPDNSQQDYYWLLDINGNKIKQLDESQVTNQSQVLQEVINMSRYPKHGATALNSKKDSLVHGQPNIADKFSEALAPICRDGKYGFINLSGKLMIKPSFLAVGHFSEGLCPVQTDSEKWGFINKTGEVIITPLYDEAQPFSSGRALIRVKGQFGYIDKTGKYIVKPKYDFAYPYSGQTAIVSLRNWNHPIMRGDLMSSHLDGLKIHRSISSSTGIYIPKDLDDALRELDAMLPAAAKEDIRICHKSDMLNYHHGFGTFLRNNWGLWSGERLTKYFNSIGISHPDDMSGKILDSYWEKLHAGR